MWRVSKHMPVYNVAGTYMFHVKHPNDILSKHIHVARKVNV